MSHPPRPIQALVRLGHIESDRLGTLLDAYKTDQAQYQVEGVALPDPLANQPATKYVVELLPRFLRRVARIEAKVGDVTPYRGELECADIKVSIAIKGVRSLEVALVADLPFAEALAVAASGLSRADIDPEMIADGVGALLNVLGGNAVSAVAKGDHRVELGPPDYDASLVDGWRVDLAVGVGTASLVLSTF